MSYFPDLDGDKLCVQVGMIAGRGGTSNDRSRRWRAGSETVASTVRRGECAGRSTMPPRPALTHGGVRGVTSGAHPNNWVCFGEVVWIAFRRNVWPYLRRVAPLEKAKEKSNESFSISSHVRTRFRWSPRRCILPSWNPGRSLNWGR
jgi:hypothetical protein